MWTKPRSTPPATRPQRTITNVACFLVHCMISAGPCLFFCYFSSCPMLQSPLGEGACPFEMISTVFLHQGTVIEVFVCSLMASANLRVGTEWKWPCNLLRGHLMKQNVFIYFPGCISSCNMFPSEAQGCRFMFEVVFNHPFAIEVTFVLRIWAS